MVGIPGLVHDAKRHQFDDRGDGRGAGVREERRECVPRVLLRQGGAEQYGACSTYNCFQVGHENV